MGSLIRLFDELRLRVNESKSAVDRAWNRPLLGVSFRVRRGARSGCEPRPSRFER